MVTTLENARPTTARIATIVVGIFAMLIAGTQASAIGLPSEISAVPEPFERIRQIDDGLRERFDAALKEYDDYLLRAPHDAAAAVQRCKFIEEFANAHESADFVDSIFDASTECFDALEQRLPEHPEVVLASLERTYGQDRFDDAIEIVADIEVLRWTPHQASRLYALLASSAESLGDARSLEFAERALRYDETADVRLIIATGQVARGNKKGVVETLMSPGDGHDPADVWYLVAKLRLLADADARDAVLQVYAALRAHESFDSILVASALRKVGAIAEAREALNKTVQSEYEAQQIARERFLFELQHGDPAQALGAYDTWRDAGWAEDPLAINRVALFAHAPLLPWRARDLLGIVALTAVLLAVAALASLPMAAVHYRGLARRARTAESYPTGGWMLRHAWFALFAFLAASLLSLYFAGPLDVNADAGRLWGLDATPGQIAHITIVGDLLMVGLLIPLAFAARTHESKWWGTQWRPLASIAVGASIALALRLPLLLRAVLSDEEIAPGATQQLLWQVLEAVKDTFGIAGALWLIVVVAPIIEEFIFRGVMLRAFVAHIGFGWANVFQAALFALLHFDAPATPMLFVVGLLAGYLARRSGGLLAPITMHFVFNLIVALAMLL